MRLVVHADGGCWPNPGPAKCGVVVLNEAGHVIDEIRKDLGHGTNNTAEWAGLIQALTYAVGNRSVNHLTVRMDSLLVVNCATGRWKTKKGHLRPFLSQASALLGDLHARGCAVRIEWVPREQNELADALTR